MSSRHERVKMVRPGVKPVLAFFLLPQFWRSFAHFSHIRPIFVQTLSIMLAQSGLLPINHPGTRHGYNAEGERISVSDIMGEAWYNLRTRPHMGFYQWGIFTSIVMMFATVVAALVMSASYLVMGTVAHAQIFQLAPGGVPVATDFATVPVASPTALFDRSQSATGDLALGILDKVLRQGAVGGGGPMQSAIGPMFGTYSTGVLIIASIVVFWSIVSIIIDSARTGQFGGGRHNMVWTPIRFVFALAMLIPVGGMFNGGQLVVMKLAEWGSNLGSNMWSTYISGANDISLLVNIVESQNPGTTVIKPALDSLTCMKRHNMAQEITLGTASFPAGPYPGAAITPALALTGAPAVHDQFVRPIVQQTDVAKNAPSITVSFGDMSNPNRCGTITLPNPQGNDIVNYDPLYTAMYPAVPVGAVFDEFAQFKQDVRQAEWDLFNDLYADMEGIACQMASTTQQANPASYAQTCPAVTYVPTAANATAAAIAGGCNTNAGGFNGDPASALCLGQMVAAYTGSVGGGGREDAIAIAKAANLDPYISGAGPGTFTGDAAIQGWAGMGAWYFKIASINRGFGEAVVVETAAEGPSVMNTGSPSADADDSGGGCWVWSWVCDTGRAVGRVASGAWEVGKAMVSGVADGVAWVAGDGLSSMLAGFPIQGASDINLDAGKKIIHWALHKMKSDNGPLLISIGGYGTDTHPMASLAYAGYQIVDKAIFLYGVMAFISLFAGLPLIGGMITALMAGPVGSFLGMIASFGLTPGLMLLYYVPLIPWTKVMFAVVAWIVSVVEAVATIPVVALAHMRTDGEGLMGPMASSAYVAWLNLLLRPGLTVIGFVMGNLIFESMILYLNDTFNQSIANMGSGGFGIIDQVINTYIYVFSAYALVNASFKLVDIIPNSTMSWLGSSAGSQDFSGEASHVESFMKENMGEFAQSMGVAGQASAAMGGLAGGVVTAPLKMGGSMIGGGAMKLGGKLLKKS
ncbi:MAG: hypothetical protein EP349_05745 [Alphaproteobacteria bacterium]|nr:MAG: hypothetical protein EP349_05745 [Alphaproteobacteria bacterium]